MFSPLVLICSQKHGGGCYNFFWGAGRVSSIAAAELAVIIVNWRQHRHGYASYTWMTSPLYVGAAVYEPLPTEKNCIFAKYAFFILPVLTCFHEAYFLFAVPNCAVSRLMETRAVILFRCWLLFVFKDDHSAGSWSCWRHPAKTLLSHNKLVCTPQICWFYSAGSATRRSASATFVHFENKTSTCIDISPNLRTLAEKGERCVEQDVINSCPR